MSINSLWMVFLGIGYVIGGILMLAGVTFPSIAIALWMIVTGILVLVALRG